MFVRDRRERDCCGPSAASLLLLSVCKNIRTNRNRLSPLSHPCKFRESDDSTKAISNREGFMVLRFSYLSRPQNNNKNPMYCIANYMYQSGGIFLRMNRLGPGLCLEA